MLAFYFTQSKQRSIFSWLQENNHCTNKADNQLYLKLQNWHKKPLNTFTPITVKNGKTKTQSPKPQPKPQNDPKAKAKAKAKALKLKLSLKNKV
jgi:hypothetical protein